MCPALRAEMPVHYIAAVGDAAVIARLTLDGYGVAREYHVDGGVAAGKVLAQPAPAQPHGNGLRRDAKAHRPAKATAGDIHGAHSASLRRPVYTHAHETLLLERQRHSC